MSDVLPKVKNEANIGQLLALVTLIIAGAIAWGTSQAEIKAQGVRIVEGEKRDEKTNERLGEVKESIIELKGDNRSIKSDLDRQGRQLDRQAQQLDQILNLLRNLPQPPPPQPQPYQPPRIP